MSSIELENLDFCYPGVTELTLSQLNLQVDNGEAHALLGASGAGKTTLLNILSGLLVPTSGRVLFDGKDVSSVSGHLRGVAQVFQFPVLYESLDVERNLTFSLTNAKRPQSDISERLSYISTELGVEGLLQRFPGDLSLFEKQLVAVGKALMRADVSLVLLDEPLTAVEPKIKWRLRQTLRRVQEDLDVTMIYVTHDQTEALTFADRVSILTDQGILQTGTAQEIYQSPEHEFIGHFVGSPGMNFLPAPAVDYFDPTPPQQMQTIGFRPEWGVLSVAADRIDSQVSTSEGLTGTVRQIRIEGTQNGEVIGLVTLGTDFGEVIVRGRANWKLGQALVLHLSRCVGFVDQKRVGVYEFH